MRTTVKKFISLILSITVLTVVSPLINSRLAVNASEGEPDTSWYDDIIAQNPFETEFEISTADQLAGLAQLVNDGADDFYEKTITLTDDIDLSAYGEDWNDGKGWSPIGIFRYDNVIGSSSDSTPFSGNFDGDNYKITGLYINDDTILSAGLFGYIENSTILNIGVIDCGIIGYFNVGGIVGRINNATIYNCYVTGNIEGAQDVGGLIGLSMYGNVQNCYTTGNVKGSPSSDGKKSSGNRIGGLIGENVDGTVQNCYATGDVEGSNNMRGNDCIGGLIGLNCRGIIQNCYATGNVKGEDVSESIGGLIGLNMENSDVQNCYATGDVYGRWRIGGVIGSNIDSTVKNCAALNINITAWSDSSNIGRITEFRAEYNNGILENNYANSFMKVTFGFGGKQKNLFDVGLNTVDGADISMETASTTSFWENTMGWDTNVWSFADGRLPILRHVGELQKNPDISWYNETDAEFAIATAGQLAGLAQLVNNGTDDFYEKAILLTDDIDLSDYGKSWNNGKGWIPIGNKFNTQFKGTLGGNNHNITGLYTNENTIQSIGLFGFIGNGGAVKNLGVVGVDVTGHYYVGGVAAIVYCGSSLVNCFVTGTISGTYSVGGVAGEVTGEHDRIGGVVVNCYSTATVSGTYDVGGVVGAVSFGGVVTNCYATGTVSGIDSWIGGVVGLISSGNVENCYSTGAVRGNTSIGGVIGQAQGALQSDNVESCVALNPSVNGKSYVGRIMGRKFENDKLSGNRAFASMAVNDGTVSSSDSTDMNGADISKNHVFTASFWTNTMGWDSNIWDFADGRLPILKNVGGLQETGIISISPDIKSNKVTVNLISPWQSDAVLIIAVYSGSKLLNMKTETITQSGKITTENITIPTTEGIIVKAFIWNGVGTMQPLCEPKSKVMRSNNWDDAL